MRTTARNVARKLLLAAVGVLVAVALLEGFLQVAGWYDPRPQLYPGERATIPDASVDPLIGWRLPPSTSITETKDEYSVTYDSNAQGFRSPYDFGAETGGLRVALLGDSYTFGSGVEYEQTYAALLEQRLEGSITLNYGIGGFGIDQMWLTLRHYALPLDADIVVLMFVRQDLDRSLTAYRLGHVWLEKPTFHLVDGGLVQLTAEDRPNPLRHFVQRHSRLVELWRRTDASVTRRSPIPYRWRLNREIFRAMRDECRAADVPFLVVHLPNNRLRPVPMLTGEFAELEIPFLDLHDLLPDDATDLYYPRDRHLNAAGHRFATGAIADFLREHRLP